MSSIKSKPENTDRDQSSKEDDHGSEFLDTYLVPVGILFIYNLYGSDYYHPTYGTMKQEFGSAQ